MGHMLTIAQLAQLEARWRAQAAPIAARLKPGLSDEAVEMLVAPLGLRLPHEARLWWQWHDGVALTGNATREEREIGGGRREYLPLEEAVALYRSKRELARKAATGRGIPPPMDDPAYWWDPAWFPLLIGVGSDVIACDCNVGPDEPSPIRAVDWRDKENFHEPVARSFGEMVSWWIDAFDTDAWFYDSDASRWRAERSGLPPERELSRLV